MAPVVAERKGLHFVWMPLSKEDAVSPRPDAQRIQPPAPESQPMAIGVRREPQKVQLDGPVRTPHEHRFVAFLSPFHGLLLARRLKRLRRRRAGQRKDGRFSGTSCGRCSRRVAGSGTAHHRRHLPVPSATTESKTTLIPTLKAAIAHAFHLTRSFHVRSPASLRTAFAIQPGRCLRLRSFRASPVARSGGDQRGGGGAGVENRPGGCLGERPGGQRARCRRTPRPRFTRDGDV